MHREAPNVQALWGALLVEELVRCGVDYFVICPGSRSTPLVQAVARHPTAESVLWADERGAAFHALGYARATRMPAAVITTSGTAVANLLPAVVEASQDGVPLLLLTADRPAELREVGANQSIRQVGIFGEHVRWAFDLPTPDDRTPMRTLLTTVDHAVSRAASERDPGPVHLNCPFREPLAPSVEPWDAACLEGLQDWLGSEHPYTRIQETLAPCPLHEDWLEELAQELTAAASGLLVLADPEYAYGHGLLSRLLGWPIWRDVRCGVDGSEAGHLLPYVDRLLGHGFEPEVVVQLGARPSSKYVEAYLASGTPRQILVVDPRPALLDPARRSTRRFVAAADHWCDALTDALQALDAHADLPPGLEAAHAHVQEALVAAVEAGDELTEPWAARALVEHLHPEHTLFVSNSMPIRDVQHYAADVLGERGVGANRGASGIDGIVSTAAGFAQGRDEPVTLLIGDMALLHDVNALAFLARQAMPVTTVVLNNGGGSIFSFLPIAEHRDVVTPWVESPHQVHFEGVCLSFGIAYDLVEDREALVQAYRRAIRSGRAAVIEVASSLAGNKAAHDAIEAALRRARDGA